jgi:uncharacterized ion transporter superfamily protein YfcC
MLRANIKLNAPAQKKRRSRPDAYVLLFFILFVCAIATYFVPSGVFDRVKKGDVTITIPGSYHAVTSHPTGFLDFFTAIQTGMVQGAPIIFLIMFTSGALAILEKTGALDAAIITVINKFRNKEIFLIIIVCSLFSLLGTVGVVVNSVIAFIPLGIMIARGLKLDGIFGVALIYLGTYSGFNTSIVSPSTLGLSQRIAELPLLSGMGFRFIIYLIVVSVTIGYIYRYARKIKQDPSKSILESDWFPNSSVETQDDMNEYPVFTAKHKLILSFAGIVLLIFIICTLIFKWNENQMAGIFIFIAIGSGLIARMSANEIAKTFIQGCQRLVYGALIVGMARAVVIILDDGKLLDTIVNGLAVLLQSLPPVAGAIGMFLGSAALHFLISSGSGESAMLMPLLVPLADLLHITRQVAVEAVMLGEGFVNCINPTSGVLMGVLAASGISYGKWLKFMIPLTVIWFLLGFIFLIIGVYIHWGPF